MMRIGRSISVTLPRGPSALAIWKLPRVVFPPPVSTSSGISDHGACRPSVAMRQVQAPRG
jgi:hypothetical protein